MTTSVRVDNARKPTQLTAVTLTGSGGGLRQQVWAGDATTPVLGIMVQADKGNAAGSYIEVGGPDLTAGNGIQLGPGESDLLTYQTPNEVFALPSTTGLILRGQVR